MEWQNYKSWATQPKGSTPQTVSLGVDQTTGLEPPEK